MGNYKDLKVYQRSYEVARDMYVLTRELPQEEQYGLTSQIRRAATSIPLNIAEGCGKGSGDKELSRYLKMARGSCAEMEVLLAFSLDFGYISEVQYEGKAKVYEQIGKMLSGLIQKLESDGNM